MIQEREATGEPAYLATLEVRWMVAGPRPPEMLGWFARFPFVTERRVDRYLLHGQLAAGCALKIRGASLLEVKLQRDDEWVLEVPGLSAAGVKRCEKWSFPLAAVAGGAAVVSSWKQVHKTRWLSRPGGERAPCAAELTDIQVDGVESWTIGLEAPGSDERAWDALQAVAAALFADPLPAAPAAGSVAAMPYSEWLGSLG